MRLLFVSDLFPPNFVGGHELRCGELVEALQKRGHGVLVLTTKDGSRSVRAITVWRVLNSRADQVSPIRHGLRDVSDANWLRKAVTAFSPQLIVVFGVFGLSLSLFSTLHLTGIPVVYDEGSYGLCHLWRRRGPWLRFAADGSKTGIRAGLKKLLISSLRLSSGGSLATDKVAPERCFAYFTSQATLNATLKAGVRLASAQVIHTGVDLECFAFFDRNPGFPSVLRLLVPSRIHPQKDQLTAVRSLRYLLTALPGNQVVLRLRGSIQDESYYKQVVQEAHRSTALGARVEIAAPVPRTQMCGDYRWADAVILPSAYEEPFSRVALEAMACGRPLVCTPKGGMPEIIQGGENAMTFAAGDAGALAEAVCKLAKEESLYWRLATNGRQYVERNHQWSEYVSRVESYLASVMAKSGRPQ